jgi:hypothetical protein
VADSNAIGNAPRTNANVRSVGAVISTAPYRGHRALTVLHKPIRLMRTLVAKNPSVGYDNPDATQYDGKYVRRTLNPPR